MIEKVIAVHSEHYGLVFCTATETWTPEEFITHLAIPHNSRYKIREIWEMDYPEDGIHAHMMDILINKDKDGKAHTEFDFFWDDKDTLEWME